VDDAGVDAEEAPRIHPMNATTIVGYAYQGAIYCIGDIPHAPGMRDCPCDRDPNGVCAENCSGDGPNPVFAGDEGVGEDVCDLCGGRLI
jgi:hypothetical protein